MENYMKQFIWHNQKDLLIKESLLMCARLSRLYMALSRLLGPNLKSLRVSNLGNQFALKTLRKVNYFLNFEAHRNSTSLVLTQTKYIHDLLVKTNITSSKSCSTLIYQNQKLALNNNKSFDFLSLYQSKLGFYNISP